MLLVIEPVEDVRELLLRFLARQGLQVVGCAAAREADAYLRAGRVGVVIVSHDSRSGLPYACRGLTAASAPPTLVLGTEALDDQELRRRLGNFHSVHMKPFAPWELYASVVEANDVARKPQRLVSGFLRETPGAHDKRARRGSGAR
jgi:DNA-binding response OmpR family regulator